MPKTENSSKPAATSTTASTEEATSSKNKQKNQGKKRKRCSSDSSSDNEITLADNTLETERNVHASAVRNNLDEISVRKIIKRVVTNDHVLALVQLREEEEDSGTDDKQLQPKLTRSKAKELKKVSPKSRAWNLGNLELTPIKHIPVKTRPEVKALIAQELPEDEDDEEYQPTHDDVPSDDDHIESCSDVDSQPRTPATPASQHSSPRVVRDGPFKVPQDVSARRRLEIEEEEATIALRTRSKLSLSSTSIEHIESTFVPPDDLPIQDVDEIWNQFLNECLNPEDGDQEASTARNEYDDETDPEYNVAADPDAQDEDEEALGKSLIKISKKELNDLVTELFNVLPTADEELAELASSVLTDSSQVMDNSQAEVTQWEGKVEPVSDDEGNEMPSQRLKFERRDSCTQLSVGKSETADVQEIEDDKEEEKKREKEEVLQKEKEKVKKKNKDNSPCITISSKENKIQISIEEAETPETRNLDEAPPSLRSKIINEPQTVHIQLNTDVTMTPQQILILQQQLRQHIQLSASNFLQLFVHPVHWELAPTYKEYLMTLTNLADDNKTSVVNVCNLKPATELIATWERSMSVDTEENRKMIEFIQGEVERSRRRTAQNSLYVGEFHETLKKVIANSCVFLYPYLLPAMPYRPDRVSKKYAYLHSEDVYIVLGLDQFWRYVESNPQIYKMPKVHNPRTRRGLMATVELVSKHMMPWIAPRSLASHLSVARAMKAEGNPIYKYFTHNEVPQVRHKLLPFNPSITLYEQPEYEMARIWARYLAKTSKRFRNYLRKRHCVTGHIPDGVSIDPGLTPDTTLKKPLPIDFTKEIVCYRNALKPKLPAPNCTDKFDINFNATESSAVVANPQETMTAQSLLNKFNITLTEASRTPVTSNTPQNLVAQNLFKLVQTSTGTLLLPLDFGTQTVDTNAGPITTPCESTTTLVVTKNPPITKLIYDPQEHCRCCVLLRKIHKRKQTYITDYFSKNSGNNNCYCNNIKYPRITKRLKMLVSNFKNKSQLMYKELEKELKNSENDDKTETEHCDISDLAFVTSYQIKLVAQSAMSRRMSIKQRVYNIFARFKPDKDDPLSLAKQLFKVFDVELMDLYLDFLGFLTPEQADKIEAFKDYFTRNCAEELMEKVEEQVLDKPTRHKILTQLKSVFTASSSSCDICSGLLETMDGCPVLANYTFSLFPHRKETRPVGVLAAMSAVCGQELSDTAADEAHRTMDYEADHSSCGDDSDYDAMTVDLDGAPGEAHNNAEFAVKTEPSTPAEEPIPAEKPTPAEEPTLAEEPIQPDIISRAEMQEYGYDTRMPAYDAHMTEYDIVFEVDESIKTETTEWKRDDDKVILEILREQLTPEERKDKTILEMLEEKNVFEMLAESLTHKSLDDIKGRVRYMLSLLVVTDDR